MAVASEGNLRLTSKSGLWRKNRGLWVLLDDRDVASRTTSVAVRIDQAGDAHCNEDLLARPANRQP